MTIIRITDDFLKRPNGRFRKYDDVTVVFDGTEGYGSSFLEEAFGGLIRLNQFSVDDIKSV